MWIDKSEKLRVKRDVNAVHQLIRMCKSHDKNQLVIPTLKVRQAIHFSQTNLILIYAVCN